jgi:hypothetical protein
MTVWWALLYVQVATFVVLGSYYLAHGNWRLGTAQLLLAAVQAIIYSAGL